MVEHQTDGDRQVFILRPNRALSWAQARRWLWLLAVPVTAVAVGWALAGVWLVLPFAGLELGLAWALMYHIAGKPDHREVLLVERDRIIIQRGRQFPERLWVLSRPQAFLQVGMPEKEVDLLQLALVDEDWRLPVAHWLNQEDRRELRQRLLECGLAEVSDRWWQRA